MSDSDDAVDHLVDWTGWEWAGCTLLTVVAASAAVVLAVLTLVSATSARHDDAFGAPVLLGLLSLAVALAYGAASTRWRCAARSGTWNRAWLLIIAVTAAPVAVMGVVMGIVDSLRRMAASIPMSLGRFVVASLVLIGAGLVIAKSQNAPGR
ncbi:hypothetical protein [Tomitella cavernea]|uniref:Uncharacterized protein n=2 Tax=Tomitella cavernea TaxID=1387982 RepID=A0ABP9D5C1_9ACTN